MKASAPGKQARAKGTAHGMRSQRRSCVLPRLARHDMQPDLNATAIVLKRMCRHADSRSARIVKPLTWPRTTPAGFGVLWTFK